MVGVVAFAGAPEPCEASLAICAFAVRTLLTIELEAPELMVAIMPLALMHWMSAVDSPSGN
jgi:hypothetical protein